MPSKSCFSLGDQNAGVFAEICEKNGITPCWLQWKFELAVINGDCSPITIDTGNDPRCGPLKDGIKKVTFVVDFDHDNPNTINYIRFKELHEDSENKHYIVTKTSIDHVQDDVDCKLWLELPSGTRKEDIGAVINLWKVEICCRKWRYFLPANPVTQLEKAHRVVAVENIEWLKTQLMKREEVVVRQMEELSEKDSEIEKLTNDLFDLEVQLDACKFELDGARSREIITPAKRKVITPKGRTPRTTSAKSSSRRAPSDLNTTPSKRAKRDMVDLTAEDPFMG